MMNGEETKDNERLLGDNNNICDTNEIRDQDDLLDQLPSEEKVNLVNLKEAFNTICALTMGSGVILCPYVIRELGAISGSIAIAIIALIQYYSACVLGFSTTKCLDENLLTRSSRYTYQILAEIVGGSRLRLLSVITLYAATLSAAISDVLLSASILKDVIQINVSYSNAIRLFAFIVILVLTPISYLGTFADLKLPIKFGLWSSILSGIGIVVNCILVETYYPNATNQITTETSDKQQNIFVSLGSIFFFTAGSICIPNICVICKEPEKIGRSITASYIVNFLVFLVIGLVPYFVFKGNVSPSTIDTFTKFYNQYPSFTLFKVITHVIQVLMLSHFMVAFLINMNIVFLHMEKILAIPYHWNRKRFVIRTGCMLGVLVVCAAFPEFEFAVSLSGGVPMAIIGTLLPLYFYIHICETDIKVQIVVYGLMVIIVVLILGNLVGNIILHFTN